MRRVSHQTVVAAAFPAAVLIFSTTRYFFDIIGVLLLFVAVTTIGLAVFTWSLVRLARERIGSNLVVPVVVVLSWLAWFFVPVELLGIHARFLQERRTYEAAAEEIRAGMEPSCMSRGRCRYEKASPVKLAFPWDGITDNWYGIVATEARLDQDTRQYEQIFGGRLTGCLAVAKGYYFCSFT